MSTLLEQINEEVQAGTVSEYNQTTAELNKLKETYGTEVPEVETKKGYDRAKSIASECRGVRVALEAKRKEIKSPAIAFGKMIDSKAKEITAEIEQIEKPFLNAYRAVDEKKKQFKLDCEQRLIDIKNLVNLTFGVSSDDIENMIDELACTSLDYDTFGHKLDEAKAEMPRVLEQLALLKAKAIEQEIEAERIESERLELEELRRIQAEREEQDRLAQAEQERLANEARIKAEAEAQAKIDAENQIKAAEQAKIDAENRAKQEAEQAEINRLAAIEQAEKEKQQAIEQERQRQIAEQQEQERQAQLREADKEHRRSINNIALDCFVEGGLTEEQAKLAVRLIASKSIDNVVINY